MDIEKSLELFRGRRVVVVGDVMLDEFVRGDVSRISPEAPVPVVEVKERTTMPGGAANTAANVASLGGHVALVGAIGHDAPGETTKELSKALGIDVAGFVVDPSRPTSLKTRIVARHQQIVRIDHETRRAFSPEVEKQMIDAVRAAIANADACIVSDYGKGVITPALVAAVVDASSSGSSKKPVVVDPKRRDFLAYKGVTVITPNLGELEVAAGHPCPTTEEIVDAAAKLLTELGGAALLVTRGPEGMSLIAPSRSPLHVPTRARAVFDVTGAGDTAVATLTLALAVGLSMDIAIEIASAAAAIAVSKSGTATVTIDELRAELEAPKTKSKKSKP